MEAWQAGCAPPACPAGSSGELKPRPACGSPPPAFPSMRDPAFQPRQHKATHPASNSLWLPPC
eukprot:352728-Chlamydomonas_euryale.AAC.1